MKLINIAYLLFQISSIWCNRHSNEVVDCTDMDKSFEEREESANVIMTGTVKDLYRNKESPPLVKADVEIKRVLKGRELLKQLPGVSSPFYRKIVTINGFGDPRICENAIHKYDTRIFLLNLGLNGELRLNSSLIRITYNNLDRADAAVNGK